MALVNPYLCSRCSLEFSLLQEKINTSFFAWTKKLPVWVDTAFETIYRNFFFSSATSLTVEYLKLNQYRSVVAVVVALMLLVAWLHLISEIVVLPVLFLGSVLLVGRSATAKNRQQSLLRTDLQQAAIDLQRQTERERLVILITQRLRRSLDLEEILTTTATEVRDFLQADRVVVYQFRPDWTGAVLVESTLAPYRSIVGATVGDPYFGEQFAQFYQQGGITAIDDVRAAGLDPHYLEVLTQLEVKSVLILPISQSHALWGLLVVHQCSYYRHWEPSDTNLLRKLANQLAVAVHQSELHQQVQQLNNTLEKQVQERTLQLQQALNFEAVLKRITDRVRDSLDEAQILQAAVQELALALELDTCNAALYDLKQRTATIRYEYITDDRAKKGQVLPMDEFPEVYQPLLAGHQLEYCLLSEEETKAPVAKLVCPIFARATALQAREEIIGDLWLTRSRELAFNPQETRLVEQVATQCAIALRQARLYQASQAQVEELERLNRLKDDFLSTVSHELRTPMASIKIALQMLELSLKPSGVLESGNRPKRYLQILKYESEREIQLINDLLDLSRLDRDSDPLQITTVVPAELLPQILAPFAERTQQQRQQLQLHLAPDLPAISTDLGCLERLLTELLQNACKYTLADETIALGATPVTDGIQFWVTNSGSEIALAERDRIFEKFYRIPNNDPWKHGGTGLGLALVKQLVTRLGGSIDLKSDSAQTSFIVYLPLVLKSGEDQP